MELVQKVNKIYLSYNFHLHVKYKVIEAVGGVNMAVCNSFLSQLEVYDEAVGLVPRTNTAQHRCLLFPVSRFLSSALIIKIGSLLDNSSLCQLADEETPTADSENLGTTGNSPDDEESEDYNDISSKFQEIILF